MVVRNGTNLRRFWTGDFDFLLVLVLEMLREESGTSPNGLRTRQPPQPTKSPKAQPRRKRSEQEIKRIGRHVPPLGEHAAEVRYENGTKDCPAGDEVGFHARYSITSRMLLTKPTATGVDKSIGRVLITRSKATFCGTESFLKSKSAGCRSPISRKLRQWFRSENARLGTPDVAIHSAFSLHQERHSARCCGASSFLRLANLEGSMARAITIDAIQRPPLNPGK